MNHLSNRRCCLTLGSNLFLASFIESGPWSYLPRHADASDHLMQRNDVDSLYTRQVDQAIEKGLEYLSKRWNPEGGFRTPRWGSNAAVCGLAGLLLLGRGVRSGFGTRGTFLESIGKYVLRCCTDSGLVESASQENQSRMYEHGFATLFLAELHGAAPSLDVRTKLKRAVELILRSQNKQGGWRYDPFPNEADLSVTVCQVMALRAARNAGIAVPNETIEKAIAWIKRGQNPDGGFMYQITGGESRFPLTAAAIVAMYNAGISSGPEIDQGIEYLLQSRAAHQSPQNASYFFYGHYYSVQAFWHRGQETWTTGYQRVRDLILPYQQADGSWYDHNSSEFGTSMAGIILNMPRSVLPIFQR